MRSKRIYPIFTILLCLCLFFSSACVGSGNSSDSNAESSAKTCTVMLSESPYYTATEYIQRVEEGESASFMLTFQNGYTFEGVSYADYVVETSEPDHMGQRQVALTLNAVKRDIRVEVTASVVLLYYTVRIKASDVFTCENAELSVEAGQDATFALSFDGDYTAIETDYHGDYYFSGVNEPENEFGKREIALTLKNIQRNEEITVRHGEYVDPTPPVDEPPPLPPDEGEEGGDDGSYLAPPIEGVDNVVATPVAGRAVIRYVLNGGAFINGGGGRDLTMTYALASRPRPNTEIGSDIIRREGHTLVCWNTRADGKGTRVSLGSRAPVTRDRAITLYAQWAPWTDAKNFEYVLIHRDNLERLFMEEVTLSEVTQSGGGRESCAVLTAYLGGSLSALVVPEYIDGYPVGGVYTGAIRNQGELKTVVIPTQTEYVYDRAFVECNGLVNAVVHDGMSGLTDHSFGEYKPLKKLYVNTVEPLTCKGIDGGYFAHKMEMLIAPEDPNQGKIVVWGTCATMYAVQSAYIEEYFPGKRDVVNMGVVGEIVSLYQIEMMLPYLNAGDAFVQLLDIGIPYAFFADNTFDIKVFQSIEDNYDLLTSLNMRSYSGVLSAFSSHVRVKHDLVERGGTFDNDYVLGYLTEDGDAIGDWPGGYDNTVDDEPYNILTERELIELDAFTKLNAVYERLQGAGLSVYVDISPFNSDGVDMALVEDMDRILSAQFARISAAKLIGTAYDAAFDKAYIYDANYHLSAEGSVIYTERLCSNLRSNW